MWPKFKVCKGVMTEKYVHATFFFNGGVESQFKDEERFMIPSPKVAMYDLQPEMSVQAVAEKFAGILVERKEYDFVMSNFAPPDMRKILPKNTQVNPPQKITGYQSPHTSTP
ncbi:hypothetical protein DFH09DRAFT_1075961 [Mycena vulgaris]|nr:hypothetical protein DFH09DRAFT_1075961 [Mycena vulgaris]